MQFPQKHLYEFGPFRLDTIKRLLWREGEAVPLTSKSFETLLALIESRGEILDKDELLARDWPDTVVEEKNLTINISTLRKALGESPQDHHYIVTVPGRGYRFVADVREIPMESDDLIVQASRVSVVVEEERDYFNGRAALPALLPGTRALRPSRMWKVAAVTALVAAVLTGVWRSRILQPDRPAAIKTLAVLPFRSWARIWREGWWYCAARSSSTRSPRSSACSSQTIT
jgi:DNA-binding winged helix-turn-helix (wHTH) protein